MRKTPQFFHKLLVALSLSCQAAYLLLQCLMTTDQFYSLWSLVELFPFWQQMKSKINLIFDLWSTSILVHLGAYNNLF